MNKVCWLSVVLATASLVGCATDSSVDDELDPSSDILAGAQDLVAIPKATTVQEIIDRTGKQLRSNGSGEFYLAIRKNSLGDKWFWATYLEQLQPYGPNPGTLGTRVVRFKVQNDKLYMFDADDHAGTSDVFSANRIIDAFPIVKNVDFGLLPGSGNYVIIDIASGQNRFGALADWWADGAAPVKVETELSFVEDFKAWPDGGSFAHTFSAYTDEPIGTPTDFDINEFHVAATTRVTLRRYYETPGYTPTANPGIPYFFTSDPLNYGTQNPTVQQNVAKWAIHPGMQPIKWKIGREILQLQQDPSLGGADLYGAIKRGIESWNDVFGYTVVQAELASPNDRFGDDHYNYVMIDPDPSAGYAYADWRTNPNTTEVRGASIYFSSAFFFPFPDDAPSSGTAQPAHPPAAKRGVPRLVWQNQRVEPLCVRYADDHQHAPSGPTQLTGTQKIEQYVEETIVHEIGHTFGLRHNFKGSLNPPTSSVMDYNVAEVAFVQPVPGPYDHEAINYLYGNSGVVPTQPFCTDDDTFYDPNCVRFDPPTPTPLDDYQLPEYLSIAEFIRDGFIDPAIADLYLAYYGLELMGFARGGDPVEAPAAWRGLVEGFCDAPTGEGADAVCGYWFRDLVAPRGAIANPVGDATVITQIATTGGAVITSTARSYAVRRAAVDALKLQQSNEAYLALTTARTTLQASLPGLDALNNALTSDLIARLDAALAPYFE